MRKLKVLVLIAIFATSFVPHLLNAQENSSALEKEKQKLIREIATLEERIEQYHGELEKRHKEITSIQNEINLINTRLSKLNAEIRRTQSQIEVTRLTIQETRVQIDSSQASIERNKAAIAELLRNVYVASNDSLIEQLLSHNTLSEALAKTQYLSEMHEQLTLTVGEIKSVKRELENHEAALQKNRQVLEEKNRELGVQKSAEQTEREYRNTILKRTEQEEESFQELLSEAEKERSEFMKRIVQIEDQIRIQENFVTYFAAGQIPPPGTKIFIWPQDNAYLTQRYGYTAFARGGAYGGNGHNGIDMSAGLASPIKAAAGGIVIAKGDRTCYDRGSARYNRACNGYWGNWVAIEHPGGLVTLYSHMTRPSHRAIGEKVSAGDVIGYEGASGNVTGPHLHFSVYTEFFTYADPITGETRFSYNFDKTLDPLDYLY